MAWYCCYSVVRKGTTELERSNNVACYAQWVHKLTDVDRVVVHIPMSDVPGNGAWHTEYSNKQIIRYLRALQRAGFKFKFSAKNILPKQSKDYYGKPMVMSPTVPDIMCFNVDIDMSKCSHINAQLVMFCVRFLHEKVPISRTFFRFLNDERKAKKKSGVSIFNKMLIAMQAQPGSGHSFGANAGYNLLLTKEQFKEIITDSKIINTITSGQLPITKGGPSVYGYNPAGNPLPNMVKDPNIPFEEVLKVYKAECAKYM